MRAQYSNPNWETFWSAYEIDSSLNFPWKAIFNSDCNIITSAKSRKCMSPSISA